MRPIDPPPRDGLAQHHIDVQSTAPWVRWTEGNTICWFAGNLLGLNLSGAAAARHLASVVANRNERSIHAALGALRGNFAFIVAAGSRVCAAVDMIRSIPIFHARKDRMLYLSTNALQLRNTLGLTTDDIDDDQAFVAARSGYTLGPSTLYRGLDCLQPGEIVIADGDGPPRVRRYYTYRPWLADPDDTDDRCEELATITLDIFKATAESAGGRPIAIPLSGGLDSRLVAAGLKQVGYDNIVCFAYGLPGNWEADVSQRVAKKLACPWFFLPLSHGNVTSLLRRGQYVEYMDFADSCASVPVIHEYAVISLLRDRLPADAIVINGQSGDYLTGGHVPRTLTAADRPLDTESRRAALFDPMIAKHFRLWSTLENNDRDRLERLIWTDLGDALPLPDDPRRDYGLVEFSEWQNRQCRYVVTNQRIYEFFGLDWRLPLWDLTYLRFWEQVPAREKIGQSLFRRMLHETNWGGVWRNMPAPRWLSPSWVRTLRPILKATVGVSMGRKNWKDFDRRYLSWWTDLQAKSAVVSYREWIGDKRGFRHAISFLTEQWLRRHGRSWSGERVS